MFVGVGAYTSAYLSMQYGLSPWIGLAAAIAVGGAFAWVVGKITLKLSGHYLALATIAWNVSFFYLFGSMDMFGRYDGIASSVERREGKECVSTFRSRLSTYIYKKQKNPDIQTQHLSTSTTKT